MPDWTHLSDLTSSEEMSLNTVVALLREHVCYCDVCQAELAKIDRNQAAINAYGDIADAALRGLAIELVRTAKPDDTLYPEIVAEPLIREYLSWRFPKKKWRTS